MSAVVTALRRLRDAIVQITEESEGVAGMGENGEFVPWSEFEPGGLWAAWLGAALTQADDALAGEDDASDPAVENAPAIMNEAATRRARRLFGGTP